MGKMEIWVSGKITPITRKNKPSQVSSLQPVKTAIKFAQGFGVFPINTNTWQFSIREKKFWYSLLVIALGCFLMIVSIYEQFVNQFVGLKMSYFLFLFLNCCVNVNFLFVAQKWERLMNQWNRLDRELKGLMIVDMNTKSTNASTLRWFFILFISTALNYVMLTLSQGLFILSTCFEPHQHELLGESFFHQLFPDFFKVIPFHISLGILVLAIDSFLHVAWVFNDSFIIIVSLTIAKTFEIFNHKLKLNLMNTSQKFWVDHIDAYKKLSYHVKHTNEVLGMAILISLLTNLYLVCIKLLISLSSFFASPNIANNIPLWLCLLALFYRMLAVCYFAAKVNGSASDTVVIINSIPISNNLDEIRHFNGFLATSKIALTGNGFFALTKGLILTLTGTIVTYELVLIQFYDKDIKSGNLTVCPF